MARIQIPVRFQKTKGGGFVTLTIDLTGGEAVSARAFGKTPAGATMKAAALAQSIAKNPIFQALAPPGSAAAVKAIGLLARGVKAGNIDKVIKKFAGKGAKRLIKRLKFW